MKVPDLLRADADTYDRKAADYAQPDDPWLNFREAEEFREAVLKAARTSPEVRSTLTLIGLKLSRLKNLGLFGSPKNEPMWDTLGDLRVYLGILEVQVREVLTYAGKPPAAKAEDR